LKWDNKLQEALLHKRYKRFLADITLDGLPLTAHVPNTGSMLSCWGPEWRCAVSVSNNPNRKMPYTLELTWNGETWIGVNTANANKLAKFWLQNHLIHELTGYKTILSEKKVGLSRVDFYLEDHPEFPPCYVEVKSVTLKLDELAQFPDSVSERGQKHLKELMELKKKGFRAVMLFIVQREDVNHFRPALSLDPTYAKLLRQAYAEGVEVLVYQCRLTLEEIGFKGPLSFDLG
jgi:sugar fermentation stimulation protein A